MSKLIKFQLFMFSLLFIIAGSVGYWFQNGTLENVHINVIDKQRVTTGSTSKYMIFTDNESFESTDSFFHSKYNSSDIYGQLNIKCSYEVRIYGWRMPFFSIYRNIIGINKEGPCS